VSNDELFDHHVEGYDETLGRALSASGENRQYFADGRVAWLAQTLSKRADKPGAVLDYGCGDGSTTPLLLEQLGAQSAVGVDVSSKSLDRARARYGSARIKYAEISETPSDGLMDLAYCNGVFHHIPLAERPDAVACVNRALRPGGLFSFWENNPWNPGTRYVMAHCDFDRDAVTLTPPEARTLLRAGGFEILRTDFRFVFPRALRALRPLEDILYRLPVGAQYHLLCRKLSWTQR
jgi:SAM-dependent methyltransferase